ncbi:MAG: glycosyltransferase family 4 protein [Pseudomonadota bacterium]
MTSVSSDAAFGAEATGGRSSLSYSDASETAKGRKPLTVLQVVPRLDTGGVERTTLEITEAICTAGGRALVATAGGQLEFRIQRAGGEIFHMNADSKNPLTMWQNARLMRRLIREESVDIVHARSRAPAWSAYWATRSSGTPFMTTFHGTYNEEFGLKKLYNSIMARGRPVIANSEFIRKLIIERYRLPQEQIVTIPRGADIGVFSEESVGNQRAIKLAESWGLIEDPRAIVLMPGRLTRWKGAESMIDAAAQLKEMRGPDFAVLLVGDDDDSGFRETLQKRIDAAGAGDVVYLTGACQDMAAAYKLSSVVVSASIEPEAFGRVIVEAQAMSRPVIATSHGGARETVAHGESGWLYPPGDSEVLAATIHQALEMDPSARAHMGLAGRARIHTSYTVSAMQRATLDVYEQVAGRTFQALI